MTFNELKNRRELEVLSIIIGSERANRTSVSRREIAKKVYALAYTLRRTSRRRLNLQYRVHFAPNINPQILSFFKLFLQPAASETDNKRYTNGRQRGLEVEKPREIWVGRGGSGGWGGGRAEDCKEEENP